MNYHSHDHVTCTRCGRINMLPTDPPEAGTIQCLGCGLTLGGALIRCDFATRVALADALHYQDIDQLVRVALAAHADGLLEVAS